MLTNRISSPISAQSFGAKYPTKGVLEIVTGRHLGNDAWKAMTDIFEKMGAHGGLETAENVKNCKKFFTKNIPALKKLPREANKFFKKTRNQSEIQEWIGKQIKKFGEYIEI